MYVALLSTYLPMTQQTLLGQDLLIIEASRSHWNTPHSVGLLWTNCQPEAKTSTWQTTHITHKRQTSMPQAGLKPAIPTSERPQTHASDHAATGIGFFIVQYHILVQLTPFRFERHFTERAWWNFSMLHPVLRQIFTKVKVRYVLVFCECYLVYVSLIFVSFKVTLYKNLTLQCTLSYPLSYWRDCTHCFSYSSVTRIVCEFNALP